MWLRSDSVRFCDIFKNADFLVRSDVGYLVFKNAEKLVSCRWRRQDKKNIVFKNAIFLVWSGVVQKNLIFKNSIFLA